MTQQSSIRIELPRSTAEELGLDRAAPNDLIGIDPQSSMERYDELLRGWVAQQWPTAEIADGQRGFRVWVGNDEMGPIASAIQEHAEELMATDRWIVNYEPLMIETQAEVDAMNALIDGTVHVGDHWDTPTAWFDQEPRSTARQALENFRAGVTLDIDALRKELTS